MVLSRVWPHETSPTIVRFVEGEHNIDRCMNDSYSISYGAILVSKFNNILTTCDISFWCTNFQEGYIFWGTNFLKGYKFPEGIQISWRDTNFLEGYKFLERVDIFGW